MNVKKNDYGHSSDMPKNDKRLVKWKKQRKERGFDDSETWCLASAIAAFIVPRLKRFREVIPGYPGDLSSIEEWEAMLDKMIMAFELVNKEDGSWMFNPEEQKQVDEGLDLFRERFFSLWT